MADIDWKSIAAPLATAGGSILGGVLGGPAGAALGPMIGQVVGAALGVDPTPEAIGPALQLPGASDKIAQAEMANRGAVISAEAAYLADIESARQMAVELAKSGSNTVWAQPVLAGVIVTGFIALVAVLTLKIVPDSQIAMVLFGALANEFAKVGSFYFGSSQGSAAKTDALASLVRKAK